jgi:hypothetical protein
VLLVLVVGEQCQVLPQAKPESLNPLHLATPQLWVALQEAWDLYSDIVAAQYRQSVLFPHQYHLCAFSSIVGGKLTLAKASAKVGGGSGRESGILNGWLLDWLTMVMMMDCTGMAFFIVARH